MTVASETKTEPVLSDKGSADGVENIAALAQKGHTATDKYRNPLVHIDPVAERKLRLKCDCFLVPPCALLYLFCFIDRANVGNARLAGLERDLGLAGYDYNIILTVFYVAYTVFELPSVLLCKRVGPGLYLPFLTLLFGVLSFATAYVKSFGAAIAVRFLLGVAEAGVLPSLAFYFSRWYTGDELAFRLSLYIVCAPLAGAFGGLLASAILTIDEAAPGIRSWRAIFWVEGLVTMGVALLCFFLIPDRPERARWLTEEEKVIAEARIKAENVGSLQVIDDIKAKTVISGIFNVPSLVIALIFLFDNITVQGYAFFLPTIIRTLYPRTSVISQQLRTVPPYIVGAFFTVAIPFLSWKTKRRGIYMIISAPLVMLGFALFVGSTNPSVRYAGTFFVAAGSFSFGALCNAWASVNVTSDTARAGAIGVVVMFGNLGGLISTWSYLPTDGPSYYRGNGLNLATSSMMLLLSIALIFYMRWHNSRKDRGLYDHYLDNATPEEAALLNQNHPSFRMRF